MAILGGHQIKLSQLAKLCRRVGTSLQAGIDARQVWSREAAQATGTAVSWEAAYTGQRLVAFFRCKVGLTSGSSRGRPRASGANGSGSTTPARPTSARWDAPP